MSKKRNIVQPIVFAERYNTVAHRFIKTSIQNAISRGSTHLLFDLSQVSHITNVGVGRLSLTYLELTAKGIQVTLVGVPPKIQRLLDRHGLSRLLAYDSQCLSTRLRESFPASA